MQSQTDPETLRIPAFMRKRNLARRMKRPLVLTAFDRAKAGILPEGLKKPKKKKPKRQVRKITQESIFSPPFLDYSPRATPKRRRKIVPAMPEPQKQTRQKVGKITHYYEKIQVGVLLLTNTLSVGDPISYETADGLWEQIVDSMEIDRSPVFRAVRGEDVGIKLRKPPIENSPVFKLTS